MANRHTLHKKHLEEFKSWLETDGWKICDAKGEFEVLFARKAGRKYPLILYSKLEAKEHITVRDMDWSVVAAFFRDRKRCRQ